MTYLNGKTIDPDPFIAQCKANEMKGIIQTPPVLHASMPTHDFDEQPDQDPAWTIQDDDRRSSCNGPSQSCGDLKRQFNVYFLQIRTALDIGFSIRNLHRSSHQSHSSLNLGQVIKVAHLLIMQHGPSLTHHLSIRLTRPLLYDIGTKMQSLTKKTFQLPRCRLRALSGIRRRCI